MAIFSIAMAALKKTIDKNSKMSDYSLNEGQQQSIFVNA